MNNHVHPIFQGMLDAIADPFRHSVGEATEITSMDRERLHTAAKNLTEFLGKMDSKPGYDALEEATRILTNAALS